MEAWFSSSEYIIKLGSNFAKVESVASFAMYALVKSKADSFA